MANPAADALEQAQTAVTTAMATLAAERAKPGSDKPAIDAQLDALQDKSDALDAIELAADVAASQKAIDDVNAAGQALSDRAREMTEVADALTKAGEVIDAAASFITEIAPFL